MIASNINDPNPIENPPEDSHDLPETAPSSHLRPTLEIKTRLNIPRWLNDRNQRFQQKEEVDSNGRTIYELNPCPFDPTHINLAQIKQAPDGKLSGYCSGKNCPGKSWNKFKSKIGPPDRTHYETEMSPSLGLYSADSSDSVPTESDSMSEGSSSPNPSESENSASSSATQSSTLAGIYGICGGRIVRIQPGVPPQITPLCNVSARIVEEVIREDGAERRRMFAIEGRLMNGQSLARIEVAASEFSSLQWVVENWGARAIIYVGHNTKEHIRAAIQELSKGLQTRTIYEFTGWHQIDDQWCYLHGNGAIGPQGLRQDIEVSLTGSAEHFRLPPPPQGKEQIQAVRASLGLLDGLAPDRIVFPLLASIYRSVLGSVDYSLFLTGLTGTQKSELAALAQQHFGAQMTRMNLPGSWSSTANALEGLTFAIKDAICVIDDFCPTGPRADIDRMHVTADRLFRGQGNHSGRARMKSDGITLRAPRPCRGLILATGEDLPRGHSLSARLAIVEVQRGDVNLARLTDCQRDALTGLYAQSMAGFLAWLAPRYPQWSRTLTQEKNQIRDQYLYQFPHARTPDIIANLLLGFRYFLEYALAIGAIDQLQQTNLMDRGMATFQEIAASQSEHQRSADPIQRFLSLVPSLISSGRAHIAHPEGEKPPATRIATLWGWEARRFGSAGTLPDYVPNGRCIGWLKEDELYLDPNATYGELQSYAIQQGEPLSLTQQTLWTRLNEQGLLLRSDKDRNTCRITLSGSLRKVVIFPVDTLFPPPIADCASQLPPKGTSESHCTFSLHGFETAPEKTCKENTSNSQEKEGICTDCTFCTVISEETPSEEVSEGNPVPSNLKEEYF